MKHQKLLLAVIALLVAGSPVLVQGAQHVFTHPTSLPSHASDNARKALADRGTHGHEGNETGDNDNEAAGHDDNESATGAAHENDDNEAASAANVSTTHTVDPGESVTVMNCISNSAVSVNVGVVVTPGQGATASHTVTPLNSQQVIAVTDSC